MEMQKGKCEKEFAYLVKDKVYKVPIVRISLEESNIQNKKATKGSSWQKEKNSDDIDWEYFTKYLTDSPTYLDNYLKQNPSAPKETAIAPKLNTGLQEHKFS